MITDFLRTRRKDLQKDRWWSTCIWYFFLFSLVTIAGVNLAFFVAHWQELSFDFSETSIYITFVGFLFAFAGINIYSIFNTNIEEEKKRLYDLNEKYKDEIKRTMCLLDFSKKHIKYYQLSQMISGAKVFNIQLGEWLGEFDDLRNEMVDFLYELSLIDKGEFESMSSDFTDVNRSVCYLFGSLYDRINANSKAFFAHVDEELKNRFLEQLSNTISEINDLQTKDFSEKIEDEDEIKELGFMDGINIAWRALWRKRGRKS